MGVLLGAALLVGAGVGGTLGVQHFTGGKSPAESWECERLDSNVWEFMQGVEGGSTNFYVALNSVLDARHKACHP